VSRSRKGLTAISVAFDESLDPASAENPGLYLVLGAVKKRGKTVYSKGVAIGSVRYDGNARTVTISLARPYKGGVQVTVHGGILGTNGLTDHDEFTAVAT
jgi:hypothetical protein